MSETKTPWTPGPWIAVKCDAEPGDEIYEIFDGDMEGIVCESIGWLANAHLIAAAPAMAEALEELLACAKIRAGNVDPLFAEPIAKAEAALALSRGEKPE